MKKRTGILLVNLGTPDSPSFGDVWKYLIQFLTDWRVIDYPWLKRQLLVRGVIVPFRTRNSASSYQAIWTQEGSPLLVHGQNAAAALQKSLGEEYCVELAMRYQSPSIEKGLNALFDQDVDAMVILPLFPQYASASTGSVHQEVMRTLSSWQTIPEVRFIHAYPTHPKMIEAYCAQSSCFDLSDYDHILFSFHGLPVRQLIKADRLGTCMTQGCCKKNRHCYAAQSYATASALAKALNIPKERSTVCFQSRLGKDPWQKPYTSDVIHSLAKKGAKRLLVFSPAFVADCLETIYEISTEYQSEFIAMGGEKIDLVPSLNDHPLWIEALADLVTGKESVCC